MPQRLAPVYETIERVVAELPKAVPLIGFCGAPWTVATYMVEGGGSKDQAAARLLAYRDETTFQRLIDLLVEVSADYLVNQVKAGARVLQIFDSWAGSLAGGRVRALVHRPDQETRGAGQGEDAAHRR